jgi:hypothetical protein
VFSAVQPIWRPAVTGLQRQGAGRRENPSLIAPRPLSLVNSEGTNLLHCTATTKDIPEESGSSHLPIVESHC